MSFFIFKTPLRFLQYDYTPAFSEWYVQNNSMFVQNHVNFLIDLNLRLILKVQKKNDDLLNLYI